MVDISRREAVVGGIGLLSGCVTDGRSTGPAETDASTTAEDSETSVTPTDRPDESRSPTPEPDASDPHVTLGYGESAADGDLRIVVETPTVETALDLDRDYRTDYGTPPMPDRNGTGKTESTDTPETTSSDSPDTATQTERVELSDGRAAVFVPATLTNRSGDEEVRLAAPNFVLVAAGTEYNEVRSLSHPDVEGEVRPGDTRDFPDQFDRWTMHGTPIEPGETVTTVAAFEVPADVEPGQFDVVFDPSLNTLGNEFFEHEPVAWTREPT